MNVIKKMINFEDFKKLDLRIAKVINAERVKNSEKLLRLELNTGDEKLRQIVAGIAEVYAPEDLIGREIVIVANLEPKIIFGLESNGMLLAANEDGKPTLLKPDQEVLSGTKIQ